MSASLADPGLIHQLQPRRAPTARGPVEYVEFGEGPVVVALHGAMGGWDQSLLLAQAIGPAGYRYLAVSRPGYLGTPLAAAQSAAAQGELLAALLDELGVATAGVMAVSGGGPAALALALGQPARCRALVLASTCASPVTTPIPWSFKLMKFLARRAWFAARFRRKAARNLAAVAARSIRDPEILARTLGDPEVWPLFQTMLLSTFDHMGERLDGTENDIAVSQGQAAPLEEVAAPVLVVHGTADPLLPFAAHAAVFQARLPRAELLAVPGGEHAAIFTHRSLVRPRVAEFLARHLPAAA
ncbi:MAG: alpha/beta hydrolase [Deltaproteobacteria bacterium]|nr:alpha/beta hydrolase [Deltaproteobacteria bacterium]